MARKFGARKDGKYKVVCIAPSVNLTQVGNAIVPIPYKVQQKLSSGEKVSDKKNKEVNFNGKPVYLEKSDTGKVKGDGKGSKGGVKSGTVEAKSEPLVTTPSVRIYKQQLIRVKDMQYMQNKNTLGKVQSSESGSAPDIKDNGEIEETVPPPSPKSGGSSKNKPTNNAGSGGLGSRSGSPVLLKTGQLFIEEDDGQLKGQIPLTLERCYISGRNAGMFGQGWRFVYEHTLATLSEGNHTLLLSDGREFRIIKTEAGYQDTDNLGVSIDVCVAAGIISQYQHNLPQDGLGKIIDSELPVYRLTYFDDGHTEYYQSGRLVLLADSNLNVLRFKYQQDALIAIANAQSCGIKFRYSPQDQVIAIEDHSGRVWRYEYSRSGELIKAYNPLGSTRCYDYDSYLSRLHDECNNPVLSIRYDEQGRVSQYIEGEQSFRYTYQQSLIGGRVVKTDQDGAQTFYGVDSFGAIFAITHPDGSTEKEDYAEENRTATVTDRVGNTHSKRFDQRNRLIEKTDSAGQTTTFDYIDTNPYPVKITREGKQTQLEYDARFNLTKVTLPDGSSEAYEYDTWGNRNKLIDALGAQTQLEYNALGLPTRLIDAKGNHNTWEYDPLGRALKTIQADGATQSFNYDARDRIVDVTDPSGAKLRFRYIPTGQLASLTDSAGNTTRYEYNSTGYPIKETRADERERHFTWTTQGQLSQVTQADGSTINFDYDKAGHLKRKIVGGETTEYTFDAHGHLHQAKNPNGSIELYYHKNGAIQTETQDGIDVDTAYNEQGVKIMQACLDDQVVLEYDDAERLTALHHSVFKQTTQSYDEAGRLTQRTYPNQTTEQSQYDELAQLTSRSTAEQSIDYRYDLTGRIIQKSDITYAYDPLGRLTQAGDEHYDYDASGNLQAEGASYNENNNQLLETDTHTFTYYTNGQLRSKEDKATQQSTLYIYNTEGQLTELHRGIKAQAISESFFFKYDALGRRIQKLYRNETGSYGIKYLYSGHNIVALLNEKDELLARITHDEAIDTPISITTFKPSPLSQEEYQALCIDEQYRHDESLKQAYYYHRDHQGSILALTDEDGDIVESYEYDAYGNTTRYIHKEDTQTFNPYAYTGREYDAPDLYYYRARYYDPTLKRFISEDPIGFLGGDVNWYRYVSGNPVGFTDPFGFACDNQRKKLEKAKNDLGSFEKKVAKKAGVSAIRKGTAAAAALVDGPLPIGDAIAVGTLIYDVWDMWGIYDELDAKINDFDDALEEMVKCEKKAKKGSKDDKKKDGIKITGEENCGKVTTYGKSKQEAINVDGTKEQMDRDHIPASSYMIAKAKQMIDDGEFDGITELNDCMKKAIVNNAPVIIVPKSIHQLGHTYGKGGETIMKQRGNDLTPNEVAKKDIETYSDVLKKEDAINKKGEKLTQKDKDKLKKANRECEKKIKKGLEEMKKKDYDKFLEDQIKDNKNCP